MILESSAKVHIWYNFGAGPNEIERQRVYFENIRYTTGVVELISYRITFFLYFSQQPRIIISSVAALLKDTCTNPVGCFSAVEPGTRVHYVYRQLSLLIDCTSGSANLSFMRYHFCFRAMQFRFWFHCYLQICLRMTKINGRCYFQTNCQFAHRELKGELPFDWFDCWKEERRVEGCRHRRSRRRPRRRRQ